MNSAASPTSISQWKIVIWLLRLSCFFVFVGRGWQHLIGGDAPFRTVLWNEDLLTPLVNSYFGMSWNDWATSEAVDSNIQLAIRLTGAFYFICAVLSVFVTAKDRLMKITLAIGSILLTSLAFLYYMDRFFQIAQFLEYAAQFMAPGLLIWAVSTRRAPPFGFEFVMRIAVALTFICHGLYAVGYYPVPGNFVDMVIQILGVTDDQALNFLFVAAILDFAVGGVLILGIFQPYAYGYAVFWGLATTFARLWAHLSWDHLGGDLMRWLPEFLHRIPHWSVPAAGLVLTSAYVAKKAAALLGQSETTASDLKD